MIYLPELFYFDDTPGFPLKEAVAVTAQVISQWCSRYNAKLLAPKKGVKITERKGLLPADEERQKFIKDLINWIFTNSIYDMFALFLYRDSHKAKITAAFDHHDDTCCWALNLAPNEFEILQKEWSKNGLPKDMFYPEGKEKRVVQKKGRFSRALESVGFTIENSKIYTPKQWQAELKKKQHGSK